MGCKIKVSEFIDAFLILLFSAYYCMPVVFVNTPFYLMLSAMFLYVFFTAFFHKKVLIAALKIEFLIILIVFLLYKIGDVSTIEESISKIWSMTTCFFPAYLLYRFSLKTNHTKRSILICIGLMYSITLVGTFIELLKNPKIMRVFAEQTSLYRRNIGHFDFAYANIIVILIAFALFKYLKNRSQLLRFMQFLILTFLIMFQCFTQYTLSIMMVIILVTYSYTVNAKRRFGYIYIFIVVAAILLIPAILKLLIAIVPFEGVQLRLNEIYLLIVNGIDEGIGYNTEGRLTLYSKAVEAFFNGFFTGNRVLLFDSHSSFLSIIAHTGIWGAIALWALMRAERKSVQTLLVENGIDKGAFQPAYLGMLIMSFTNPSLSSFCFNYFVFFVFSAMLIQLGKYTGYQKSSNTEQKIKYNNLNIESRGIERP